MRFNALKQTDANLEQVERTANQYCRVAFFPPNQENSLLYQGFGR